MGPPPVGVRLPQGPDTINGGGGNDRVDFSQRTQPLTVDLDGEANDGEAGERDNVQPDVEEVIGGSQDDTLIGSTAANLLEGRDGQDTIEAPPETTACEEGPAMTRSPEGTATTRS